MTSALVSPVIPATGPGAHGHRPADAGLGRTPVRRTLPLPTVPTPRIHATVYGLATLDRRGRVADLTVLRALDWTPGTRCGIREHHGLLIIHADPHGAFPITGQGHLRLTAPVRRRCGLLAGDRVLLAADPARGQLVVYPPAALDTMIAHHAGVSGGDPA